MSNETPPMTIDSPDVERTTRQRYTGNPVLNFVRKLGKKREPKTLNLVDRKSEMYGIEMADGNTNDNFVKNPGGASEFLRDAGVKNGKLWMVTKLHFNGNVSDQVGLNIEWMHPFASQRCVLQGESKTVYQEHGTMYKNIAPHQSGTEFSCAKSLLIPKYNTSIPIALHFKRFGLDENIYLDLNITVNFPVVRLFIRRPYCAFKGMNYQAIKISLKVWSGRFQLYYESATIVPGNQNTFNKVLQYVYDPNNESYLYDALTDYPQSGSTNTFQVEIKQT